MSQRIPALAISLALVLASVAVFAPVRDHTLVDFDDYIYLRDNPRMDEPLDGEWLWRNLNEPYAAYWIPLTWLSYRIGVAAHGNVAACHLLVNVGFHAINSVLLFYVLFRMTRARWRSAFVAAVFALHPLHVESVAWASERKDVLSACFWLLAMLAHAARWDPARPPRSEARARWLELSVAAALALGLLAKPSLVTLPFSLLLLDFWPLRRFECDAGFDFRALGRATFEKLPLFGLCLGAGTMVFFTQQSMGGMNFASDLSWPVRLANAVGSYFVYIGDAFWPTGLAVFYPHPTLLPPLWRPLAALAGLLLISALAFRQWRRRPWFTAGWFWFLGNLVPVIGIVGVGMQSHADRWMYLPLIGLAVIVAWGANEAIERRPRVRAAVATAAVIALCALAVTARMQVVVWRDTRALFEHAVHVVPDNWFAHHRLAVLHRNEGRLQAAESAYLEALIVMPGYAYAQGELADVLAAQGRSAAAELLYANVPKTGWLDPQAGPRLAAVLRSTGHEAAAAALRERHGDRGAANPAPTTSGVRQP